jgi:hypothetical protein
MALRKTRRRPARGNTAGSYTLRQIIEIADRAYDNGEGEHLVLFYHKNPKGKHGDGLARFIAVELKETFEPGMTKLQQVDAAAATMETATKDIARVRNAFFSNG